MCFQDNKEENKYFPSNLLLHCVQAQFIFMTFVRGKQYNIGVRLLHIHVHRCKHSKLKLQNGVPFARVAEKTLQRLWPYYTFGGSYRPDRPRKVSIDAPRRASTSSADRPRCDPHPQNCDKTDRTNHASKNNTTDIEYTTKGMADLVTPRVTNLPAEVSVEQSEGMVDLHDTPSYTEGSSRVILTNDGTKACLALLLTDEMVSKINQISTLDRQVRALKGKFHDADCAASIAQMYLDESSDLINVTEEKMTKMEEKRDKTLKRKQQIADILTSYKNKLAFARDQLQERFEDALHGAGLFTSKPDDEIAVGVPDDSETQLQERFEDALHGAGLFTSKPDDEIAVEVPDDSETQLPKQMPGSTSYTDTTSITVEHQNRLAAYESMKERKEELQELQDIFDDREQRYDQEILSYRQAVENGDCWLSRSLFDRMWISEGHNLMQGSCRRRSIA